MEVKLFDAMSVAIPDGFAVANKDEKKAHFGSTPVDYAFLHHDKSAAVGITRTGTELVDAMVEPQLAAYQQHYSRMVPGFQMGEMRKSRKTGRNVAFMTYKSNAPARDLYNILAITTLDEKEIIFLCSCDMKDAVGFMYKFLNLLESLSF